MRVHVATQPMHILYVKKFNVCARLVNGNLCAKLYDYCYAAAVD